MKMNGKIQYAVETLFDLVHLPGQRRKQIEHDFPKQNLTRITVLKPTNQALAKHLLGSSSPYYADRMFTDTYATDSYQNVLLSLISFRKQTSKYPAHITIISHDFKKSRFLDLHLKAIKWPRERVSYIGIDPPEEISSRGELDINEAEAVGAWERDLYGVGTELAGKRRKRGWKDDLVSQLCAEGGGNALEVEVCKLLGWGGGRDGTMVFPETLPWEKMARE
ncbi:uncharacterized protein KY384_006095 [Bacidia gigantensis]|uniref:uncharacterized protein n=1 Tax=Bacidia gigantensis TaxID=2732470 RepID=UPI001D04B298|nr:uncharacterized protein KY384_006095 [Bacidia gigantensis]KAG8529458.1 hypothetical protein KY384_006095 [Bacidia gigantensis]